MLSPETCRFFCSHQRRSVLGQSPKVDDLFFRLHNRVQEEVQVQRRLLQVRTLHSVPCMRECLRNVAVADAGQFGAAHGGRKSMMPATDI